MSKNVFTLEAVVDWLKTKPPEQEYDFPSMQCCLVATYLTEMGVSLDNCPDYANVMGGLPSYQTIAYGDGYRGAWTYGAALERAEIWMGRHK